MQIQHYQIRLKTGIFFKNMSEDGLFNIYLMNYFLSFLIFSRKSSIKSVVSLTPTLQVFLQSVYYSKLKTLPDQMHSDSIYMNGENRNNHTNPDFQ